MSQGFGRTLRFDCNTPTKSTAREMLPGEELGQGCRECNTFIAGSHNFKYCPNCGAMLVSVETDSNADVDAAKREGREPNWKPDGWTLIEDANADACAEFRENQRKALGMLGI